MNSTKQIQKKFATYSCASLLLYNYRTHIKDAVRGCPGLFVSIEDLERKIGFDFRSIFTEANTSVRQLNSEDRKKFIGVVTKIKNATSHAELIKLADLAGDISTTLERVKINLGSQYRNV